MRSPAAELKQILLCPPLILWHLIVGLICLVALAHPLSNRLAGAGNFAACIVPPLWAALLAASVQKELLSRKTTFALPAVHQGSRDALLLAGLAASAVSALTTLAYPGLTATGLLLAALSMGAAALAVYAVVAALVFLVDNAAAFPGLVMGVLFVLSKWQVAAVAIERRALFHPVTNTLAAAAAVFVLWRLLSSPNRARRLRERRLIFLQSAWSIDKQRDFALGRKVLALARRGSRAREGFSRAFDAVMGWFSPLSTGRYVAGVLQMEAGAVLPYPIWSWLAPAAIWMLLIGALGYVVPSGGDAHLPANLALILPAALSAGHGFPSTSSRLQLPGGRRQRLVATLSLGVAGLALTALLTLLICAWYLLLARTLPVVSVGGESYPLRQPQLALAWFPLAAVGWVYVSTLVFRRWSFLPNLILLIAFCTWIAIFPASLLRLGPAGASLVLAPGWLAFVACAAGRCFRGDLRG